MHDRVLGRVDESAKGKRVGFPLTPPKPTPTTPPSHSFHFISARSPSRIAWLRSGRQTLAATVSHDDLVERIV